MQWFSNILTSIFLFAAHQTSAQELRVLTSFPQDLADAYVAMWQQLEPETEIRILNKNTVAGINEILRGNDRDFDLFWASSPEAFELLSRNGSFLDDAVCGENGPAATEPFALSSVGWARRIDSTLFMPAEWNDLLRPIYRDKIAMARPARSGTTHMLVEQLLLVRGWDDGWAYLLELAGNLSTLTARSYGVPGGLANARFEIGLTIDFLAQSQRDVLNFRYGQPIVLVPAQVGILKGGLASDKACDFIRMLLSRDGQLTLLSPEISRIPYDASVRAEVETQLPDGIAEALRLSWLDYDAAITADRYWAVNTLFDLLLTEVLVERRNFWRRYYELEQEVAQNDLRDVRALLSTIPISEEEARAATLSINTGERSLAGIGTLETTVIAEWRGRVTRLMHQIDVALRDLEQQAPQ
jgi:phosphoglycerate transport regulatory protein PgtC